MTATTPTENTTKTTSAPPPIPQQTIVFSHDINPFDPNSISFKQNSNANITKPTTTTIQNDANSTNSLPFNGSPISKYSSVLPLANNGMRQQRVHVFRPLFVYRQQEAMKNRVTGKPPINPDRYRPHYTAGAGGAYLPPYQAPYYYNYHVSPHNTNSYPEYLQNDVANADAFDWFNHAPHDDWLINGGGNPGYLPIWKKK